MGILLGQVLDICVLIFSCVLKCKEVMWKQFVLLGLDFKIS